MTIIFVATEIMTTLTNYVSNLPNTFERQLSTKINDAISQKINAKQLRKNILVKFKSRIHLDFKSQNLLKKTCHYFGCNKNWQHLPILKSGNLR